MVIEQATYSIGVVARMTGISVHTLRMWERRYSIVSSRRTPGGQRAYTLADIDHLKLLRALTRTGVRIGDVAKLPVNQLMSLLLESSDVPAEPLRSTYPIFVVGEKNIRSCGELKNRFPQCAFSGVDESFGSINEKNLSDLSTVIDVEVLGGSKAQNADQCVLLFSLQVLQPSAILSLKALSHTFLALIVSADYVNPAVRDAFENTNVYFFNASAQGSLNSALNAFLLKERTRDSLAPSTAATDLGLPSLHPKFFTDEQLAAFEQQTTLLDCECPPHIVALIQKLSAFEEYSRGCEVQTEAQAILHTCVYAYAAQARHLMEKALLVVAGNQEDVV